MLRDGTEAKAELDTRVRQVRGWARAADFFAYRNPTPMARLTIATVESALQLSGTGERPPRMHLLVAAVEIELQRTRTDRHSLRADRHVCRRDPAGRLRLTEASIRPLVWSRWLGAAAAYLSFSSISLDALHERRQVLEAEDPSSLNYLANAAELCTSPSIPAVRNRDPPRHGAFFAPGSPMRP
ncbi:hypothetical protein HMN09_01105700 [Mycena chlorophos]|uniref:Uncharacterized protein n=1 Tax=Mycena chlorophos TaxID=658473 RepID=A0A8H6VYD8_MYCCL|nr:hypothetical protein HMN09_01105700 [Mycena chlorophos]